MPANAEPTTGPDSGSGSTRRAAALVVAAITATTAAALVLLPSLAPTTGVGSGAPPRQRRSVPSKSAFPEDSDGTLLRIAVLGSSHAEHAGLALAEGLPPDEFVVRSFVTDAATMWKNVSWCGGIHFPIWNFLPELSALDPHVVVLSTGASDSRGCFWDRRVQGYSLGEYYGQNLKEMLGWLTARGAYVLLVTPPAFLHGKQVYGDCSSVDKLFGHGQPERIFNETRIEEFIVPAQRSLAERMWNVGFYDLHALTLRRKVQAALYRDCCHLKGSAAAYSFYERLFAMMRSLRAELMISNDPTALCRSSRCRSHNAAVATRGAPTPEPFDLASDGVGEIAPAPTEYADERAAAATAKATGGLPAAGDGMVATMGSNEASVGSAGAEGHARSVGEPAGPKRRRLMRAADTRRRR